MDTKERDKEEARGSALLTKMLGALVIAGLVVMAVLVGTASANGNATIEGKNETVGYDEAININDLLTLLKLLTPGNYDLLLDMHEAGGYDIGGDIGDSSQRTQIKDSNLNFMVSESSGPEIDVTKTVSPAVVTPGTNVTFTITVTNTYDCILKPVKVVDILAEGLSYLHDDSGGKESPERTITWDDITGGLGLEPEETITITFVAHIDEDATGPLTDIVTATGTPQEDFSDSDEVAVDVLLPDISVTKTASPTVGVPGTDVTFTLEVRNIGNCILDPVRMVDTLPAGMSYVSADSGGNESSKGIITWTNVGPLNSTEGTTISLVAHIDTGASSPLIDNVTVWGTPPAGEDVTDYATADVTVPGIITPSPTIPPGTIPPGTMPPGTIPPTGEYPPTQVPVFTAVGLIALMGLLSVIAVMTLKRRK